VRPLNY
jgi:hypothetical protein